MESSTFPDRGTGYNYFDGANWGEQPSERVEPLRSGWPSIAPYGENGEILASHDGSQINVYIRETKGTGDWSEPIAIPNPTEPASYSLTWPRIITSGPNHDIIHVVAADQDTDNNSFVFYCRSVDAGANWEVSILPGYDEDFNKNVYSADSYYLASYGDNVAVFFTAYIGANAYILKSTDNGENWEKQMIFVDPYHGLDWETDEASIYTDTLYCTGGAGSVTMDKDGMVHVVFDIARHIHSAIGTNYNWWPYTDGIVYWNETMGVIENPNGNPHDALEPNYLYEQGKLIGFYVDEDGSGSVFDGNFEGYERFADGYRVYGCSTFPSITIADDGSIAVAYSTLSESRNDGTYYYRSAYASYKDPWGNWYCAEDNLSSGFIHLYGEVMYVTGAPYSYNGSYWISYQEDDLIGTSTANGEIPVHAFNDNLIYVVRLQPEVIGMNENINVINYVENAYPNPASEKVSFNISLSQKSENVQVSMHNIAGQLVYSDVRSISAGNGVLEINTSNLQSGVYFCTITVNNHKETKKVVIK